MSTVETNYDMPPANKRRKTPTFDDVPFRELIKQDERLAAIRQAHADRTDEDRRRAADWAYHSSAARSLFNRTLSMGGMESPFDEDWPEGVVALAIDPTFAPAILTVGSIEYQLGRIPEALALFQQLLKLPADTEDLEVIIDKAGDFLLDEKEFKWAAELYAGASELFPRSSGALAGLGYCLGKLKRLEESVAVHRRAVALEPDNCRLLSDLGWALTEAGALDEAEAVLENAVRLAPPDYTLAQGNLDYVRRLKQSPRRRSRDSGRGVAPRARGAKKNPSRREATAKPGKRIS